jgi:hypothetical protein
VDGTGSGSYRVVVCGVVSDVEPSSSATIIFV